MTSKQALRLIVDCQPVLDWLHDYECLTDAEVMDKMVGSVCPTGLLEIAMFVAIHVLEDGKCPACGAFLPKSILEIDNPDLQVYNQKCSKCGAEVDYVPGLFIGDSRCNG